MGLFNVMGDNGLLVSWSHFCKLFGLNIHTENFREDLGQKEERVCFLVSSMCSIFSGM